MAKNRNYNKEQSQNKDRIRNKSRSKGYGKYKMTDANEFMTSSLDRSEFDGIPPDNPEEAVDSPDVNDNENKNIHDGVYYNTGNQNIFEFNRDKNISKSSQRGNCLFLCKNGERVEVRLSLYSRDNIVKYENDLKKENFDENKSDFLYHITNRHRLMENIRSMLQEFLDGFYSFEIDEINHETFFGLFDAKEIASVFLVRKDDNAKSDQIRKWISNMSLQLENGLLISFSLLTPPGKPNKSTKAYFKFRKKLGMNIENKIKFYDEIKNNKHRQLTELFKRSDFNNVLDEMGIKEEKNSLKKDSNFEKLVESLKEKELVF